MMHGADNTAESELLQLGMVQTKMEPNKDEAETKINSKASTFIKLYGGRGGEGRGGEDGREGKQNHEKYCIFIRKMNGSSQSMYISYGISMDT